MEIKFNNITHKIRDMKHRKLYRAKKQLCSQTTLHDCLIFRVGKYLVYLSDDGDISHDDFESVSVIGSGIDVIDVHDKVTITVG